MRTPALVSLSLSASLTATLLAGCGGSQPPVGVPGAVPQSREMARWDTNAAPAYKASKPLLFVVNFDSPPYDAVTIYDPRVNNAGPLAVINTGLSSPNGDCVDGDGTLYVGSDPGSGPGWIAEYALGQTKPFKTITDGIDGPALCAIDSAGNLWVANNGGPATVTEYLRGSTSPHEIITKGLTYPISVAFDHAGYMYVANHILYGTTNVQIYPPGGKSPTRTITDGVVWPTGIAIDAQGTLYLANDSPPCNIEEYRAGASHPYKAITDEINGPGGLSFSRNGWLYVSDEGRQGCSGSWPAVLEFRPGSTKPSSKMISKGLHTPVGIAYFPPLLP
jgi:DNA-binding beta-propeller fold protein YncE